MKEELQEKIAAHTATVGVVGLGYVGLPLLVEMARAGLHALGFEVDKAKAERVNRGDSYIPTWRRAPSPKSCLAANSRRPPTLRASPSAIASSSACPLRSGRRRSRTFLHPRGGRRDQQVAQARAPRGAGVNDLSGHHRRGFVAALRGDGLGVGHGLSAGVLARKG